MTVLDAVRSAIAGKGLKLRYRKDGTAFAITERTMWFGAQIATPGQVGWSVIATFEGDTWRLSQYRDAREISQLTCSADQVAFTISAWIGGAVWRS